MHRVMMAREQPPYQGVILTGNSGFSEGCTGCQLMINVDSSLSRVAPPKCYCCHGSAHAKVDSGPGEMGEIDAEFI